MQYFIMWACKSLSTKTLTWGGGLRCKDANSHPPHSHDASQQSHIAWYWPHPSLCHPWNYPLIHTHVQYMNIVKHKIVISEPFLVWYSFLITKDLFSVSSSIHYIHAKKWFLFQFVPILFVISTSSMLILDQRTMQIKYR
jgi:hypothetical protein